MMNAWYMLDPAAEFAIRIFATATFSSIWMRSGTDLWRYSILCTFASLLKAF
jgi:hypothetical protein